MRTIASVSILLAVAAGCDPPASGPPGKSAILDAPVPAAAGPAAPAAGALQDSLIAELRLAVEDVRKDLTEKGEVNRMRAGRKPGGVTLSDILINSRVRTRLQDEPDVPFMMGLEATTENGLVTLTGRVGSVEQVQKAMLAAFRVPEVTGVTSRLKVEPDDVAPENVEPNDGGETSK